MLSQYNPVDIEYILRHENPEPPFPPASNRSAWNNIRDKWGEEVVEKILREAETAAAADIPPLTATMYLEFNRNGERAGYQRPRSIRRRNHTVLTIAECLEYKGRFLDPLMDLTWAICEESSWAVPAHQGDLAILDFPIIDLHSSLNGTQLAEMDLLLGDELNPRIGQRIRDEVDRRLFTPYLTRHDHWWLYNTQQRHLNNWTAVCNGNIVMTAIYLEEDLARLAKIIARAARSLDDYLDTYDIDGGSSEGPGPWQFGFSNYTSMAQLIEHRTNGKLRFMDGDFIKKIAQFPLKTMMGDGRWVNFADTRIETSFPDGFLVYTAERTDTPKLLELYHEQSQHGVDVERASELPWQLRRLFWCPLPAAEPVTVIPNKHDWYSGMHWMFARMNPSDPHSMWLAAKGGHNGEMHNQNDVGSFIVQLNGEQVIADIGRGRFTRFYFGANRYEDFSCQSYGHSCPVPNGQMQGPLRLPARLPDGNREDVTEETRGSNFYATLLEHQATDELDLMKIEMKNAYPPAADLDSLVRTIALHRDTPQGWVEVIDEVTFDQQAGAYESVLITFGTVEISDGEVLIQGEKAKLKVQYDSDVIQASVDLRREVSLEVGLRDVSRIQFKFPQPQRSGIVRLRIYPA